MSSFKDINEGHFLELMDRLYVVTSTIEDHVVMHPLVTQNKDHRVTKHIETAIDNLWEAYQQVANLEDDYNKSK